MQKITWTSKNKKSSWNFVEMFIMMLLTTKKKSQPVRPRISVFWYPQKTEMRGRRVWDFFLVVNNIIMNISTKFQIDFLFFEVWT